MKQSLTLIILAGSLLLSSIAMACNQNGNNDKSCTIGPYFISPLNGETVSGDITIKMGVHGLKVHPAGTLIDGTGHHHLIIDGKFVPENTTVPKDKTHMHFGKGQTETTLKLKPGKHHLTLQFADGFHQSYGKIMSSTIEINVK